MKIMEDGTAERNIRCIKRKKFGSSVNRTVFIITTLMLPLIHTAIFWLYVNLDGIVMAFQDSRTGAWTMDNFVQVWEQLTRSNGELAIAFRNTMLYFLQGIVMMFVNLLISFFVFKKIPGYKTYRVIFYLPSLISGIVLTTVFQEFIKPMGPLGSLMELFGVSLPETGLLADSKTATYTIMMYGLWTGFGASVLLYNSSMSRIPKEVLEAAKLDGCGPFREAFNIVLPMIMPMFTTMFIMNFAGIFSASGPVLLFTQGNYETTTISYWMFEQVYGGGGYGGTGQYNLVSAFGLCLTVVAVPLTMAVRKLADRVPTVDY